jgi:hypothetical protein
LPITCKIVLIGYVTISMYSVYSGDEILDLDHFLILRDAIEIEFDIFTPEGDR